jgi:hypothetical protein
MEVGGRLYPLTLLHFKIIIITIIIIIIIIILQPVEVQRGSVKNKNCQKHIN